MPLPRLHVEGYRSLRHFSFPMRQVNIVTGANGTGKSNLYQALMLVARACRRKPVRSRRPASLRIFTNP